MSTLAEPASFPDNPDASCRNGIGPAVAVGDGSVPKHLEQAALGIPLLGTVVVGWALQPQPKRGGARGPVRKPKGPRGRARQPKEATDGMYSHIDQCGRPQLALPPQPMSGLADIIVLSSCQNTQQSDSRICDNVHACKISLCLLCYIVDHEGKTTV